MEQSNSSTPERELLKLIEGEKESSGFSSGGNLRGAFSFSVLKGRFSFFRRNFLRSLSFGGFSIASFNRLLLIVLLCMTFYVSFDIATSASKLNRELEDSFKLQRKAAFNPQEKVSLLKNIAYYVNKAKKRDIFNIVVAKREEKLISQKIDTKKIIDKTKHLKLVGIAWSDNPDAMIEDTRAKKTLFVKEGDSINEIRVKRILKDKVILSFEGEDIELK